MVQHLISEQLDVSLVEINCSSNLSTNYIMHKLHQVRTPSIINQLEVAFGNGFQHCLSITTFKGTMLKPKKGKLVLYLRNMHLLGMDAWGTNMVVEFLNQVIVSSVLDSYKLSFYHQCWFWVTFSYYPAPLKVRT